MRFSGAINLLFRSLLLTVLVLVPLAYSVDFSTTLIFKETLAQTLILLALAVWFTGSVLKGKIVLLKTPYTWGLVAYLGVAVVSLFFAKGGLRTSLRDLSLFITFVAYFHLLATEMKERLFRRIAISSVIITSLIVGTICILQFLRSDLLDGTPYGMVWKQEDPRLFIASTIGHNISVATYFMGICFIGLGFFFTRKDSAKAGLALALVVFCLFLIVAAETRGVYFSFPLALAAVGGLLAYAWGKKNLTALFRKFPIPLWALLQIGILLIFWGALKTEEGVRILLLALGLLLVGAEIILGISWLLAWRKPQQTEHLSSIYSLAIQRFVLLLLMVGVVASLGVATGRVNLIPRIQTMNYNVLIKGTRLRLWTISLDMIRDNPVFGVGFQNFKFRYPEYQGRYFEENQDSEMVPTSRHTDRVHNDPLQVAVDTGLTGFLVFLLLISIHFRYQWKVLGRTPFSEERARSFVFRAALFGFTYGVFSNSFVSFYFHVVSDVLILVFIGALIVSLDRMAGTWEIPMNRVRAGAILWIPLANVFILVLMFRGPFLDAAGDSCFHRASRGIGASLTGFRMGMERLGGAGVIQPQDHAALYRELAKQLRIEHERMLKGAALASYRGQIKFHASESAQRLGDTEYGLFYYGRLAGWDPEEMERRRNLQTLRYEDARILMKEALEEYRFHRMYFGLAELNLKLAKLVTKERAEELRVEARNAYREAARIYPPNWIYPFKLGMLLLEEGMVDEALEAFIRADRAEPAFLADSFLPEARKLEQDGNFERAEAIFRMALEVARTKQEKVPRKERHLGQVLRMTTQLIEFYERMNKVSEAETTAMNLYREYPERPEAFAPLQTFYNTRQRWDDMERIVFEEMKTRPMDHSLLAKVFALELSYRRRNVESKLPSLWQRTLDHESGPGVNTLIRLRLMVARLGSGLLGEAFSDLESLAPERIRNLDKDDQKDIGEMIQTDLLPLIYLGLNL